MTRFAWLQCRTQTLLVAGGLALLAAVAAVTGVHLSHLYTDLVRHCETGCDLAESRFLSHDNALQIALPLVARAFPALVGVFWGAPLVARELEAGTHRLAWTQSVGRTRWVLTKLAVVGLATAGVSVLLTLTVTWWFRAVDAVGTNRYAVFDERGVVVVGYALFAFALGAFVGAVLRRTVPAMATTLAAFVVARVATLLWVRPHLLAPVHKTVSLLNGGRLGFQSSHGSDVTLVAEGSGGPQAWTLSSHLVTSSGRRPGAAELTAFLHQSCPGIGQPPGPPPPGDTVVRRALDPAAFDACRAQLAKAYRLVVTYQPANRYGALQWLELTLFLASAVLLAAGCWWWVTRRSA